MVVAGLVLAIITIVIIGIEIICTHWIKKVTNCYFLWATIGIFFFVWFVVFRFYPDWNSYIHSTITDPSQYGQSIIISKAWILDVCPFFALALAVSLFADPTRKIARSLAPTALIGGLLIIGSLVDDNEAELTAQYIFFGTAANPCYFLMHFFQVVISIGVLLNTPNNGWKGTLATFAFAVCYYAYVAIVMTITGARWNVSGLSVNDWSPAGEYYRVSQFINIPAHICPYVCIPILYLVGCGFVALKDYVFNRGWFRYGNAYSGKWYCWYDLNVFVKQRIL